jgi:ATP-dependent DNA ligase
MRVWFHDALVALGRAVVGRSAMGSISIDVSLVIVLLIVLVTLIAFDLLQIDGEDIRREPIEARKKALEKLLRRTAIGIEYNEHIEGEDGSSVFEHACRLGFEGIVSKRKGSRYQSGRSSDWLKMKNPNAPAATREFEEDWSK